VLIIFSPSERRLAPNVNASPLIAIYMET